MFAVWSFVCAFAFLFMIPKNLKKFFESLKSKGFKQIDKMQVKSYLFHEHHARKNELKQLIHHRNCMNNAYVFIFNKIKDQTDLEENREGYVTQRLNKMTETITSLNFKIHDLREKISSSRHEDMC